MRISEVHVYQHDLPVVGGPYRMSSDQLVALDSPIVKVVTETGVIGYGETRQVGLVCQARHALGARAALQELAPHLIGENALQIEGVGRAMVGALNGRRYAKAAVDVALWDFAGKAYRARVCDLLVGAAPIAKEKQERGSRCLQLKVGGRRRRISSPFGKSAGSCARAFASPPMPIAAEGTRIGDYAKGGHLGQARHILRLKPNFHSPFFPSAAKKENGRHASS